MARYCLADPHWHHKNIIQYEHRPFSDVEHMNKVLIHNYNNTICKQDVCIFAGDVSWGNKEMVQQIISQLNGYKILVMGNHDRRKSKKFWHDVGFNDVIKGSIIWDEFYIISHEPIYLTEDMPYINIHGHLHSKTMSDPRYVNVGVELNNYTPVLFNNIKKRFVIEEE